MGFRTGAFATVWETKEGSGNWTDGKLTISRKNKQSGEYEVEFSGFVRFIGDAHRDAGNLGERARIKIGDCDVTNRYDKDKKVTYTNFEVFSFDELDSSGTPIKNVGSDSDGYMSIPDDEEPPFM